MKDLPFCLNVITENDIRGDCVATLSCNPEGLGLSGPAVIQRQLRGVQGCLDAEPRM